MAAKDKKQEGEVLEEPTTRLPDEESPPEEEVPAAEETPESPESPESPQEPEKLLEELEGCRAALAQKEEQYLRLAAEYDNYRKRTTREKESAWTSAKGETAKAFLPVYDDLERALRQETADEAYRKGVEMTMNELKKVFSSLGLVEIPALGQPFDANVHSAVMHVEDDAAGENTVVEVFQTGFTLGDQVIRYAMVKVAN